MPCSGAAVRVLARDRDPSMDIAGESEPSCTSLLISAETLGEVAMKYS